MSKENLTLGCFRLLGEVSSGDHGTVYKAVCEKEGFDGVPVGTVVALKVLTAQGGDTSWSTEFRSRVDGLKTLSHPGIARCFGCFLESGSFCDMHVLVTEWLEGETLRDRLSRNPEGLDADEVLRTGEQVLSALAYVSSVGIVHRNVRPESIFLCKDGSVKLVDFELPRASDHANGPEADECGAFPYLAPDFRDPEFQGDEQSDIFSLGVCLHEMLAGRLPYQPVGDRSVAVNKLRDFRLRWQRINEGDDPIRINPWVTRLLVGAADVLGKALQPNRTERYSTFADFAAAFKGMKCRELSHDGTTWRLLKLVGRGGFGDVFMARDLKTGQLVAIKHLSRSEYANRFRREARALASLNDSSIVRFISFFEKRTGRSGQAFLVMEYLDGMPGSSLRAVLNRARGTPLPRDVVIRAFARYAHGLSAMHAKGFVHRDIKPANLYFPEKAIGRVAIMDLAIVRDVNDDDRMVGGSVPCTLDYAPPEIAISGSRGDAGMDVYALGLSLYEALSGKTAYPRLPRENSGMMAFLERAMNKTRPNLDESFYSDLPDLVQLVREMTEPDVDKRLKNAAEVERRLRALFSGGKQYAEVASKPSSTREDETGMTYEDSQTETLTASESFGLQDMTYREDDLYLNELASETEDGTYVPFAFLNLHDHATIHGFRLDPSPLVAEGGQGRVFKAECVEEGRLDLHKGEVVALKFVEETPSSPSFEEFRKAVEYLREIKSPHVPRYYGCFRVERWINGRRKRFRMTVMEYLDGADLGYRVKVRSPMFYADEIMYVLDQLLEGLCELSEAGIVHRDIKPSNIFICRDGTVKLIDFDTALIRGIDLCPKNRKIVGTPEFAAPDYLTEGFRGDEISDVFSVGMTLYYMVHGFSPHRAKGRLEGRMGIDDFCIFWHNRLLRRDRRWNGALDYGMSHGQPLLGLHRLLKRSLSVDRKHRYGGFKEFRLSLQDVGFRTVQYEGQFLRIVSRITVTHAARGRSDGPGGEWYVNWSGVYGRDKSGLLHKIPLEEVRGESKIGGLWKWLRNGLTADGISSVTEQYDFQAVDGMRKVFVEIKTIEQWVEEVRNDELFPLT